MDSLSPIANSLSTISREDGRTVSVTLSNQLVRLLSEQLYQSPLKAIEELVVNAYALMQRCVAFLCPYLPIQNTSS